MLQKTKKLTSKKNNNNSLNNNSLNGIVHIQTTINNTIVTVTNLTGDTIAWASGGSSGFYGARKNTPFAAQTAIETVALKVLNTGIINVKVLIKGEGLARETTIRTIYGVGFKIVSLEDITSIPHNGCRPPKQRYV